MNFWDRQIGALDGAAATVRNYEAVIDQWEDHLSKKHGYDYDTKTEMVRMI